ncbi:MAG: hypothetical protein EOM62_17215 [Bacteroidia bacterium]|nr:hypothetical protein [Bacteroidia bacterium]
MNNIKYYVAMKSFSRYNDRMEFLVITAGYDTFQEAEDICLQERTKYENSTFEILSFDGKVNLEGHERAAITYCLKRHLVTLDTAPLE